MPLGKMPGWMVGCFYSKPCRQKRPPHHRVTPPDELSNNAATETDDVEKALESPKIRAPAARPRLGMADYAGTGKTRPRAQSAKRHQLRGAVHRTGIHLAL